MTAKRFTRIICSNDEYTGSLYCNDEPLKIEEVEFHRGARENANRVGKLKKENEQLKHSIKCLEADKMELQQYIKRMQGDVE